MIKTTKLIKINHEIHHCASVYPYSEDVTYITFYTGPECRNEQSVYILKYHKDELVKKLRLGEKSGNPIIFGFNDKIYLIYSKFTDADEHGTKINYDKNYVLRWKYCDNYICRLDENLIIENVHKIPGCHGRLARCQPLIINNRLIVPLYRESDPICEIWELIDDNLKFVSSFGEVNDEMQKYMQDNDLFLNYLGSGIAIQPTLFVKNDTIHAFSRNVCRSLHKNQNQFAILSYSKNMIDWKNTISNIPNHNNSLFVCDIGDEFYLFFNDDIQRSKMLMMNLSNQFCINISNRMYGGRGFSYPNASYAFGKLNIVHTNCGHIAWHVMDREFIDATFSNTY